MVFQNKKKITVIVIMFTLLVFSFGKTPAWSKELPSGLKMFEEMENVLVDIADRVKPAVVNVSPVSQKTSSPGPRQPGKRPPDAPSSGSGVIVDKKGYIVTNNHVVGDATDVDVKLSDKTRLQGKVVGRDQDTDLAVIKVTTSKDLPTVPLGDSGKLKVGQWVIAVGNPVLEFQLPEFRQPAHVFIFRKHLFLYQVNFQVPLPAQPEQQRGFATPAYSRAVGDCPS